jgi:methionyl-tRNA formyltransferase
VRIAFATTNDPFYLPEFFRYLFEQLGGKHEIKAIIVPPIYKGTSRIGLAIRYARTFGLSEALVLAGKVTYYRLMDRFSRDEGPVYSLSSAFSRYEVDFVYEDDINGQASLGRLREWKSELVISVSCPQLFKKELINLPSLGCLNLHGAILPKYRGVMPSFWMLANNEKEAGATLFFINERIDAGDVLIQRRFPISPADTLDSLIKKSKKTGAEMVAEGIRRIADGKYETVPLDLEDGSYFVWPERKEVLRFLAGGKRFR